MRGDQGRPLRVVRGARGYSPSRSSRTTLVITLGSIPGAFFAGIFLGLLEQMSALFISPSYSDMIVFVTFIIILVVRQVMILRRR